MYSVYPFENKEDLYDHLYVILLILPEFYEELFHPNADRILKALLNISNNAGRSPAQVALRWVLEQPAITSVIVGARTVSQLKDNLGATGWQLKAGPLKLLNNISKPKARYPRAIEDLMQERRAKALKMS